MTGAQLELLPGACPAPTGAGDQWATPPALFEALDRDRLTMTRPDEQEVRLRETRRERARCPACGKLGVLEVLTVHRPGLPSVRRTVIRCTRTARKDPRGRELASARCPLAIVNEEPLTDQAGEFREFCEGHKKGPDQDPTPAVDDRRMPQDSAPGDLCGMPEEAARTAQGALEEPPPPATSPDPEPAPLDRPGAQDDHHQEPEEEPMPEEPRTCCRCNAPIDGRGGRRYCLPCAKEAQREGRRPGAGQDRGRLMTAPACPLCGRDLVPSKRLAGYWECPDRTCSGLLREADGLPAWDEVLGSSIPDLMQASATPKKGGGSRGSRGRQKPRKVTAYRRERRYLDQDCPPAGPGDRAPAEARKPVLARVPLPLAAWLEQAANRSGLSQSAILEAGLQALADATWCTNCNLPGLPEAACVGRCPR